MVRVCHVTSVHNSSDGRIFKKQCCSLANAGYEVFLIAPNADSGEVNNVKIIGIPFSNCRFVRMFILTRKIYKKAVEVNAGIYHLHDPELLPVGLMLKGNGKKVIFDSHEDVPQQILSKEYIPVVFRRIICFIYSLCEKFVIARIDAVVAVNERIVKRISKINKNCIEVNNFPDLKMFNIENIQKKNTLCFAGSISKNYLHHIVFNALCDLEIVKYNLAGPADENYLQELKRHRGWQFVEYLGKISFENVLEIYSNSTIGIAIHDYTPNVGGKKGSLGFIKNFEFMAAGLPIICTDFVVWKEIIEKENCGICVNPHDLYSIIKAIRYLLDNPDVARIMGENGKKAVENKYSWAIQEKKLLDLYSYM